MPLIGNQTMAIASAATIALRDRGRSAVEQVFIGGMAASPALVPHNPHVFFISGRRAAESGRLGMREVPILDSRKVTVKHHFLKRSGVPGIRHYEAICREIVRLCAQSASAENSPSMRSPSVQGCPNPCSVWWSADFAIPAWN